MPTKSFIARVLRLEQALTDANQRIDLLELRLAEIELRRSQSQRSSRLRSSQFRLNGKTYEQWLQVNTLYINGMKKSNICDLLGISIQSCLKYLSLSPKEAKLLPTIKEKRDALRKVNKS